jgi:hypothetical protein
MSLLKNLQPAFATLTKADGQRDSHNYPLVQKVAWASARLTAESQTKRGPIIKQGDLAVLSLRIVHYASAFHTPAQQKGDPKSTHIF